MVVSNWARIDCLLSELKTSHPSIPDGLVEFVHRDRRGNFYIQIKESYWRDLVSHFALATTPLTVSLEIYGKGQLRLYTASELKGRFCLILYGVDKSFEDASFVEELSNKHIWGLEGDPHDEIIRPKRLNRHDGARWIPSFNYAF